MSRAAVLLLGLLSIPFVAACGAKVVRTPVFDQDDVRVFLRHREQRGTPIERHFAHPASIAPIRLTSILSRLDVRDPDDEDRERQPAIPTGVLYPLGDGLAAALQQADPNQEVVAMAIERRRYLGVFNSDYLTSLVAWVDGERLNVHLGHVDEALSRNPKESIPEPQLDRITGKLRALPGDGIVALGPQTFAIAWRDPIFRRADTVRVRPGGKIIRRTILMESTPAEEDVADPSEDPTTPGPAAPLPENLSPEQLRALADLEEARRLGEISESIYQTQRRMVLQPTE